MPTELHILYFEGDPCARKFIEGAFQNAGFSWQRAEAPSVGDLRRADVVHLSDVPAERLGKAMQTHIRDAVATGTGLLMTGGWNSFGRGGYAGGPVEDMLPVRLHDGDDRRRNVQGAYARVRMEHEVLDGLDLQRPPVLCGHNILQARPEADVVLEAAAVEAKDGSLRLVPDGDLLVLGTHGKGRTVAYASDLAPHWSGGSTDWGQKMHKAPEGEELGDDYIRFVSNMFRWAADR